MKIYLVERTHNFELTNYRAVLDFTKLKHAKAFVKDEFYRGNFDYTYMITTKIKNKAIFRRVTCNGINYCQWKV